MTADAITSAATALHAAVEQLATDDTSGQGAYQALVAQARALGAQWACLAEADRLPSEKITPLFDPWVDLEEAFFAGADAVDRQASAEAGAEAYEEQVAMEALQAQKDRLMVAIPGLANWCRAHPRAAHHGGWVLFTCAEGDALIEAVSLIVREDAEINWAGRTPDGGYCGPFRVSLPRRGWSAEGMQLLDAIEAVRCRLVQETSHA